MSWECKYKSRDLCIKLDKQCDPGRPGCVLHGRVYFPFKPEKNPETKKGREGQQSRGPAS